MTTIVLVASALLAAALAIVALVQGPGRTDRIVALDVLFAAGLALCIAAAMQTGRKEFLDAGIGLALMGFVATIGWARLVELAPPVNRAGKVSVWTLVLVPALPALPALAAVFLFLGSASLLLGAWGVLRLPDAISRQHAATKSCTTAIVLIAVGAGLHAWDGAWTLRLGAIVACLLVTLPVSSSMLARAAVQESGDEARLESAPLIDR
jgi:monovalent cation/proton antiporter MnhG/PhaG subunit